MSQGHECIVLDHSIIIERENIGLESKELLKAFNPKTEASRKSILEQHNKVLALNGLTVLGLAFMPIRFLANMRHELIIQGLIQIFLHFGASFIIFYGKNKMPFITDMFHLDNVFAKNVKKFSVYMGVIAHTALWAYYFGLSNSTNLGLLVLVTGILHFYFMEVGANWKVSDSSTWTPGVRPYGFLPFLTGALGLFGIYANYY